MSAATRQNPSSSETLTKSSASHHHSQSASNNTSLAKTMMKLMPHRRRHSRTVQKTAVVLDDYTNLLRRNSKILTADSTSTEATTICSSSHFSTEESSHNSTNNAAAAASVDVNFIASFDRKEIQVGSLLGKGAFSKVYEIQDIHLAGSDHDPARASMVNGARTGRYVLKRLKQRLLRSSNRKAFTTAAANLMLEAQYLSKLDHPHILKLRGTAVGGSSSFQYGQHDGYFLVLDRLSETLSQRIHSTWKARRDPQSLRTMPLNESELLYQKAQYALQLASAVQYLHERRIVFRDLKPSNVGFTTADPHSIQLFDFGLARELPEALGLKNELFHMTQHAGTRPYTAVEVATSGLYNDKADVYSWAMVVYEMMAEQVPFGHYAVKKTKANNNNNNKLFTSDEFVRAVYVDHEQPSFDRTVAPYKAPVCIQQLLGKCWDVDLFARPTMQDVLVQLQGIVDQGFASYAPSNTTTTTTLGTVLMNNNNNQEHQQEEQFGDCSDMSNSSN